MRLRQPSRTHRTYWPTMKKHRSTCVCEHRVRYGRRVCVLSLRAMQATFTAYARSAGKHTLLLVVWGEARA